MPDDWLEILKNLYPKRSGGQGWGALERLLMRHLANGITWEQIVEGTKSYAAWCKYSGHSRTEFVKQARTFFGRDMWFLEDYEIPTEAYQYRRVEELTEDERRKDAAKWAADMRRLGAKR